MSSPDQSVTRDATAVIEFELVTLTRWLEVLSRRSAIYERVDRAGYLVLRTLVGGPLRTTQVADALRLDRSTATRQIAVLEDAGFAHRGPDPLDGRASRLELTPTGRAVLEEVEARRRVLLETLLAEWDDETRTSFATALVRFNHCLSAHPWGEFAT